MLALVPEKQRAIGRGRLRVPKLGTLYLSWSERGLTRLQFVEDFACAEDKNIPKRPVPDEYARPLMNYFAGEAINPALLRVDLRGSAFQLKVWNALREIPRGAVRSYAGIAADIGSPRAVRAVGRANGQNPVAIVVPCHRVVQTGFGLGGYSGGIHLKEYLLKLENIDIHDGRVFPGQLQLVSVGAVRPAMSNVGLA